MKENLSRLVRWFVVAAAVPSLLFAQAPCANTVLPLLQADSAPDGTYYATTLVDPDGAGPLPANLVAGGLLGADNIALFDTSAGVWTSMGTGIPTGVRKLATMPNGDVVAGVIGAFGFDVTALWRWDGAAWSVLTSSVVGSIDALHALPNGDLLVGGDFTSIGGVAANDLATWNGSSWAEFGGGISGASSRATAFGELANGDLVVGGNFAAIGGVAANHIASWDGSTFAPLGSGLAQTPGTSYWPASVASLETLPNGDLFVCGAFATAGGVTVNNTARWNGTSWSAMGAGLDGGSPFAGWISSADVLPSGEIVVAGGFVLRGFGTYFGLVRRWNGTAWVPYGDLFGTSAPYVQSMPSGLVVAGSGIAQQTAGEWQPLDGSGATFAGVQAVVALPTGEVVVGGDLAMLNGVAVNHVAMWDGATWTDMAGGCDGVVRHLAVAPNGDVIATGYFLNAGGAPAQRLARWDGTSWSEIGGGTPVRCVPAVLPNGDVVVSGEWNALTNVGGIAVNDFARWDGSTWHAMGAGLVGVGETSVVHAASNGDVVAAGNWADPATPAGPSAWRIVRWDGASWTAVGSQMNDRARDIKSLPNGELVIGGSFLFVGATLASGVARWDGSDWNALDAGLSGNVFGVEVLPNGDVLASGSFALAGGNSATNLARFDGTAWSPVGSGADSTIQDSATSTNGDVLLVGSFDEIAGVAAPVIARLSTDCPATAVPFGAACAGSGGNNELVADTLPWTGGTFSMTASGLAPISLLAIDGGFAPLGPVTLTSLGVPLALSNCLLHITPDYLDLALSTTGSHTLQWSIPNDPMFAGSNVYWQCVVFEMDAGFNLVETTSTNALELTIGSF